MRVRDVEGGTPTFRLYDIDVPAAALGPFAEVVERWRARRPAGGYPRWRDYDVADFRGWYGYGYLARLLRDPADLMFEYFGGGIATLIGADMTGGRMSDMYRRVLGIDPAGKRDHLERFGAWRGIGLSSLTFATPAGDVVGISVLMLPLRKNEPEPTHVLGHVREVSRTRREAPELLMLRAAGA